MLQDCQITVEVSKCLSSVLLTDQPLSMGCISSNIPLLLVGTQRGPSENREIPEWVARYIKITLGEAHGQGLCIQWLSRPNC